MQFVNLDIPEEHAFPVTGEAVSESPTEPKPTGITLDSLRAKIKATQDDIDKQLKQAWQNGYQAALDDINSVV